MEGIFRGAECGLAQEKTDRTAGRALGHLVCGCLHETMTIFQKTTGKRATQSFALRSLIGLIGVEGGNITPVGTGRFECRYGLIAEVLGAGTETGISKGETAKAHGHGSKDVTKTARDHHDLVPLGLGLGY